MVCLYSQTMENKREEKIVFLKDNEEIPSGTVKKKPEMTIDLNENMNPGIYTASDADFNNSNHSSENMDPIKTIDQTLDETHTAKTSDTDAGLDCTNRIGEIRRSMRISQSGKKVTYATEVDNSDEEFIETEEQDATDEEWKYDNNKDINDDDDEDMECESSETIASTKNVTYATGLQQKFIEKLTDETQDLQGNNSNTLCDKKLEVQQNVQYFVVGSNMNSGMSQLNSAQTPNPQFTVATVKQTGNSSLSKNHPPYVETVQQPSQILPKKLSGPASGDEQIPQSTSKNESNQYTLEQNPELNNSFPSNQTVHSLLNETRRKEKRKVEKSNEENNDIIEGKMSDQKHYAKPPDAEAARNCENTEAKIRRSKRISHSDKKVNYRYLAEKCDSDEDIESLESSDDQDTADDEWCCDEDTNDDSEDDMEYEPREQSNNSRSHSNVTVLDFLNSNRRNSPTFAKEMQKSWMYKDTLSQNVQSYYNRPTNSFIDRCSNLQTNIPVLHHTVQYFVIGSNISTNLNSPVLPNTQFKSTTVTETGNSFTPQTKVQSNPPEPRKIESTEHPTHTSVKELGSSSLVNENQLSKTSTVRNSTRPEHNVEQKNTFVQNPTVPSLLDESRKKGRKCLKVSNNSENIPGENTDNTSDDTVVLNFGGTKSVHVTALHCKVCQPIIPFASAKELTLHMNRNHPPGPNPLLKCNKCNAQFRSLKKFREHKIKDHKEVRPQQVYKHISDKHCRTCGRKYTSRISHNLYFHAVDFLSGSCKICKIKYIKLCKLSPEDKEAINQASHCAPCNICGRKINSMQLENIKIELAGSTKFKYCFVCDLAFDRQSQLKQHELSFFHKLKQQHYHVKHDQETIDCPKEPERQKAEQMLESRQTTSIGNNSECELNPMIRNTGNSMPNLEIKGDSTLESCQSNIEVKPEMSSTTQEDKKFMEEYFDNKYVPVKEESTTNCEHIKEEPKEEPEWPQKKKEKSAQVSLESFGCKPLKISKTDIKSKISQQKTTEIIKDPVGEASIDVAVQENNTGKVPGVEAPDNVEVQENKKVPSNDHKSVEIIPKRAQCPLCYIDLPQFLKSGKHLEEHNFIQMCVFCNIFKPNDQCILSHIAENHSATPYQTKLACAVCARAVINHMEKPNNVLLQLVKHHDRDTLKSINYNHNFKMSVSKCIKCGFEITEWDDFHKHNCQLLLDNSIEENNICTYCGINTKGEKYNNFTFKISYFTKPSELTLECSSLQCPVCQQECCSPYEVFEHCIFHISPPHYSCNVCTKSFRDWTLLKNHCVTHSNVCRYCDKEFNSNKETVEHIKHYHGEKMNYVCNVCHFGTNEKSEFRSHMDSHNNEQIGMSKCKFCHLMVSDIVLHYEACCASVKCSCGVQVCKKRMHIHLISHEPKTLTCQICKNERLYSETGLRKHNNNYHKKDSKCHICESCGQSFRTRPQLLLHHDTIHLKKADFICDKCGKGFLYQHSLVLHIRTHTKERPFQCDTCSKAFASITNLKDHLRIHTGEKPYVCSVCQKAFTKSCNMKKHVKLVHPQLSFPPKKT